MYFIFAEIEDFKVRRIKYFQENLIALAELQIKHAKVGCAFSPFSSTETLDS